MNENIIRLILAATATGTFGCGAVAEDESVATVYEAFGEGQCGRFTADPAKVNNPRYSTPIDGTFDARPDPLNYRPELVTPTTYNNPACGKGYVAVGWITPGELLDPTGGGPTANVTVSWNDSLPTNATACVSTTMSAISYVWIADDIPGGASRGFHHTQTLSSTGRWSSWINRCVVPNLVFDGPTTLVVPGNLSPGVVQISVTGRAPDDTTRSVRIKYNHPVVIR